MGSLEFSLYRNLMDRYADMSKGTESEHRINSMMEEVVHNLPDWPKDKIGRWVGYVQCILIEVEGVTTIKAERDYTRPLFHELYATQGHEIPASVEVPIWEQHLRNEK